MHALKNLRKQKQYTQKELAQLVGIKRESVAKYEAGTRIPGVDTAARIAKALGCTVDDLLSEEK